MRTLILLEEIGLFLLSIFLFSVLNYPWWYFPLLLLLPDLSMVGYLTNNKNGAIIYNLFHHRGLSIMVFLIGVVTSLPVVQLLGIILFAHSTIDRIFGYGLKHFDSFKETHLGKL